MRANDKTERARQKGENGLSKISVLDHSAVAHKPLAAIKTQVTLRNKTQHFNIYYVTSLGGVGQRIADGVLSTCESDYNRILGYFGGIALIPNLGAELMASCVSGPSSGQVPSR